MLCNVNFLIRLSAAIIKQKILTLHSIKLVQYYYKTFLKFCQALYKIFFGMYSFNVFYISWVNPKA